MKVIEFHCILLAAFLLASCQQSYIVKGTTDAASFKGRQVTLMVPSASGRWEAVDSCQVTHGTFLMKGVTDSAFLATLFVDDIPVMPLFLESGVMHVNISSLSLRASGTPLNNKLYEFLGRRNKLQERVAELERTESQMIMNGVGSEEVNHYVDSVYNLVSDSLTMLINSLDPTIRHALSSVSMAFDY